MLGARGVREVLIEGGATVATSAIAARVVNGLTIFYTPKLIGADGVPLLTELGVRDPNRAPIVFRTSVEVSGPDVVWEGEFQHR
jgi:riboflavin biosynthesis pyrimidine reductase